MKLLVGLYVPARPVTWRNYLFTPAAAAAAGSSFSRVDFNSRDKSRRKDAPCTSQRGEALLWTKKKVGGSMDRRGTLIRPQSANVSTDVLTCSRFCIAGACFFSGFVTLDRNVVLIRARYNHRNLRPWII